MYVTCQIYIKKEKETLIIRMRMKRKKDRPRSSRGPPRLSSLQSIILHIAFTIEMNNML